MAILSGDIVALNRLDAMMHAVGADVVVRSNGKTVGTGVVTNDDEFSIDIPDDLIGEVEVSLGLHNAAPTMATLDGNDLHITVLYNNVNNFFA